MDVLCDTDHRSRSRDVTFWFYRENFFTKTAKISNCEKITFFCGLARKSHSGGLIILDLLYTLWTSGGNAGSIDTSCAPWVTTTLLWSGHLAGTPALLTLVSLLCLNPDYFSVDIWRERRLYWHFLFFLLVSRRNFVDIWRERRLYWQEGSLAASYTWNPGGHLAGTPALLTPAARVLANWLIRLWTSGGNAGSIDTLLLVPVLLLSMVVDIWRERRLYWH